MLVLPNFYYINKNISSSNTKDRRLLSIYKLSQCHCSHTTVVVQYHQFWCTFFLGSIVMLCRQCNRLSSLQCTQQKEKE